MLVFLSKAMMAPAGKLETAVKLPWYCERRTPDEAVDQSIVSASAEYATVSPFIDVSAP